MDDDIIVVGGRCAGAPTAMLLARAGFKVRVIERSARLGGRLRGSTGRSLRRGFRIIHLFRGRGGRSGLRRGRGCLLAMRIFSR